MFEIFCNIVFIIIFYIIGVGITFGILRWYYNETFNHTMKVPTLRFILFALSSWLGIVALLAIFLSMAITFFKKGE